MAFLDNHIFLKSIYLGDLDNPDILVELKKEIDSSVLNDQGKKICLFIIKSIIHLWDDRDNRWLTNHKHFLGFRNIYNFLEHQVECLSNYSRRDGDNYSEIDHLVWFMSQSKKIRSIDRDGLYDGYYDDDYIFNGFVFGSNNDLVMIPMNKYEFQKGE